MQSGGPCSDRGTLRGPESQACHPASPSKAGGGIALFHSCIVPPRHPPQPWPKINRRNTWARPPLPPPVRGELPFATRCMHSDCWYGQDAVLPGTANTPSAEEDQKPWSRDHCSAVKIGGVAMITAALTRTNQRITYHRQSDPEPSAHLLFTIITVCKDVAYPGTRVLNGIHTRAHGMLPVRCKRIRCRVIFIFDLLDSSR